MRFSCNQNELVKTLNIVSKAVTNRTTIPILKGILLSVDEDGFLTMSASDVELSIEKKIKVENSLPGEVVIQAKLFGDIIRKLPNDTITIQDIGNNVNIKCSSSEFNIVSFNADEFPKINKDINFENKIVLDKEIFKNMVQKTAFSASIDEARGIITGLLIEYEDGNLNMVALDGVRMAIAREAIKADGFNKMIISAKIVSEISRIISEDDNFEENIEISINKEKAMFVVEDTVVYTRLLDGEFINYKGILPKESKIRVVLSRNDLLEAIERASLLAKVGKNNLVVLEIKGSNIVITSSSEEGKVKEEVIISKTGEDLTIGFNSKYVIDALKAIDDDSICLLFNAALNPCLITPISGNSFEYLVLPVRISSNN